MGNRTNRQAGFTLVEILIVVVILGILAAIVIPQFTNASESARTSSLYTQLQTIRSQLELYQVQHNGDYPTMAELNDSTTPWEVMVKQTDDAGTVAAGNEFGPYLQQAPANPFVDAGSANTNIKVTAASGTDDISTQAAGTNAADATAGWIYNEDTGEIGALGFNEETGEKVTGATSGT